MQTRSLGRSDLQVPVVCFGAYALGGGYWGAQEESASLAAIRASIEAGANAIDTAPIYGFGRSEEWVGKALEGLRERALILTKVGVRFDGLEGRDPFTMLGPDGQEHPVERNSTPKSVRAEVEASLRRMRTDRLDLVQVHARDPRVPVADTMGALLELRRAGKLLQIGVSNYNVEELRQAQAALGDVPLASDQPEYSLLARGIEQDILPEALRTGFGLLVYSPLAQGLLSGRVRAERVFGPGDRRAQKPLFSQQNRARINACLDQVVAPIAARHGATLANTVLAWTFSQPGVTAVLAGARTPEQALENAKAGALVLAATELQAIDQAFRRLRLVQPGAWGRRLKGLFKRALSR